MRSGLPGMPFLGATRYKVYRSTTDSFPTSSEIAFVTLASAWDTTAVLGVTYFYWVVAYVDTGGSSPPSESDSGYRWDRRPQEAPSSTAASDGSLPGSRPDFVEVGLGCDRIRGLPQ